MSFRSYITSTSRHKINIWTNVKILISTKSYVQCCKNIVTHSVLTSVFSYLLTSFIVKNVNNYLITKTCLNNKIIKVWITPYIIVFFSPVLFCCAKQNKRYWNWHEDGKSLNKIDIAHSHRPHWQLLQVAKFLRFSPVGYYIPHVRQCNT